MNLKYLCMIFSGVLTSLPSALLAEESCDVSTPLEGQRLLRRLSLDLRGTTPSGAEIEAQRGEAEVPEALVDEMLASDGLRQTLLRYHQNLLWPNIDQIEIPGETYMLYPYEMAPGLIVYYSALRGVFTRAVGEGNIFVPCKAEPAEFDGEGNLIMTPVEVGGEVVAYQEGYVEVEPYWAPGTRIKVCGLDAQPAVTAPVCPGPAERYPFLEGTCQGIDTFATQYTAAPFRNAQVDCGGRFASFAPGCGCGPNLAYCATDETRAEIKEAILGQMLRITDKVVREGRPYYEVLTTKEIEFNGPLAHYLRWMSKLNLDLLTEPDASAAPPDLTFDNKGWRTVQRGGRHAGILTTPGYLLRFSTNRSRAHRFYNAFECSSFIPNGPLPSPFEPCSQRQDLTQRCGCDSCHQALEPMAAHWGRFAEYGFMHLPNDRFPSRLDGRCTPPIANVELLFECIRFYELDPSTEEQPYVGALNAYVFRTPQEGAFIEDGPTHLVAESLTEGRFARCTVRKFWIQMMRREPTVAEETDVLPGLAARFEAANYNLKDLLKAIVTLPAYRREP
jgi:hypothetical protein